MQDGGHEGKLPVTELSFYNEFGDNAEVDRIVNQEIPIIGASIVLILLYMSLILGGRPFVRSR